MRQPFARFDNILDECIVAIQERGETIQGCLARYPAQRAELAPLLDVVVRLQAARTLKASLEFRRASAVRMRNLVTARPRRVARQAWVLHWPQKRWATVIVLIGLWACLLIGGGAVYASGDALPGDALYPVKRAAEVVQLNLARDEASHAQLRLNLAARRIEEAEALFNQGRPAQMPQVLADYAAQMEAASVLVSQEKKVKPEQQAALVELLVTAQARQEAQLVALADRAPDPVRASVQQAIQASRIARDRVRGARLPLPPESPQPAGTPAPGPLPVSTATPEPPDTPVASPSPKPTGRATLSPWPTEVTPVRPHATLTHWPTVVWTPRATSSVKPTRVIFPQPTRWVWPSPPLSTPPAWPTPPIWVTRAWP